MIALSQPFKKLLSFFGHRLRELLVYVEFFFQRKKKPSLMIFVDGNKGGFSSGLRGYELKKELKKFGWNVVVIPHQLELIQRLRLIKYFTPDLLMFQSCRHKLNRSELYPNCKLIFDLDDADFLDDDLKERVIDCAKNSLVNIAGSRYVAKFLKRYNPNTFIVWTGSRPTDFSIQKNKKLPIELTWACSDPHSYKMESDLIKDVLCSLSNEVKSKIIFNIIGVRSKDLAEKYLLPIRQAGVACSYQPFMKYPKMLKELAPMHIGLAPLDNSEISFSAGKSFGKILAYLNCKLVVIASDAADHGVFFENYSNGIVVKNSVADWGDAIEKVVLDTPLREHMMEAGYESYIKRLSIQAAAEMTDNILRNVVNKYN
jgi:hypothetical protein